MGKLFVLEGLDGSGKSTQLEMLQKHFDSNRKNVMTVSFPEYTLNSSMPVKMYLNGDFGSRPSDVNAYAASLFYAVDRFASFKMHWGEFYNNGGTVLAGRYVTSNAIHQTAKLPENNWDEYIDWLCELEYNRVGIPKPDCVIFLDVPVEISQGLLTDRYIKDGGKKDIHESDVNYLTICRKSALFAAKKAGWYILNCTYDGKMRPREEIFNDILNIIKNSEVEK